ncbi:MAG: acyl-CoA synthetase, partial [Deltaproteobacteria bacterium]|nr:acyl-CoA synthetase [Deltaproteobacteria bacterium]
KETIPPEEIIEFCRSKIAEFKVPRYIEYRESFTLTSVGKVIKTDLKGDKEALVANAYDRVVSKGK